MITKEAIEVGYAAAQVRDIRDERSHKERFIDGLTAALAAMPGPAVKVKPQCCMCGKLGLSTTEGDGGTECELTDGRWVCSAECWDRAITPAPDLASENERLRAAAIEMQIAVGKVLEYGGTEISVWFDTLVNAQQKLAGVTKCTRVEFDERQAALERT